MRHPRLLVLVAALASACGNMTCGFGVERQRADGTVEPIFPKAPASDAKAASSVADARPRIVFLGDSLTAGLGLAQDQAYPSLLQKRLDDEGLQYQVVNAGVSGDTSAGGLSRLDWASEGDVRVMVVALGGNDAAPVQR